MAETIKPVDCIVKKGIDFLNRHGAYSSTEEFRKRNWQFKTGLFERFRELLPENPIGVDIGAADGMMSEIMRQKKSIALDAIPQVETGGKIPFIKALAENLPFRDESLDYVTVLYSFHHFTDSKRSLSECARVLKNGGLMVVMEEFPRYYGQEYFLKLNEMSVNNIVFGNWKQKEIDKYASNVNYFRKDEFEKLVASLNFETIDFKIYPPTKWWDIFFKSRKNFYVMRKNSKSS